MRTIKYLDSNSSAPLSPVAKERLLEIVGQGLLLPNASSIHGQGQRAKRILNLAREQVASSLGHGLDSEQILFTSSGSEANQTVIRGLLEDRFSKKSKVRWVTTPVEHDSCRQLETWFKGRGGELAVLEVDSFGRPTVASFQKEVGPETDLVSTLWVNNETGVITDLAPMANWVRLQKVSWHVDAAQAWGKLPIDLGVLGASYVTFSGHKIGGLAGTGVIYAQPGNRIFPLLLGKQEKGRRGGTENLLGLAVLGAAASGLKPQAWAEAVEPSRDALEAQILASIPGVLVNGRDPEGLVKRVANTLNLSFQGIEGEGLVLALDLEGFCVSAGSACASGAIEPSHVLTAMGRSASEATAAIRISLSEPLTEPEISHFTTTLAKILERMRRVRGMSHAL